MPAVGEVRDRREQRRDDGPARIAVVGQPLAVGVRRLAVSAVELDLRRRRRRGARRHRHRRHARHQRDDSVDVGRQRGRQAHDDRQQALRLAQRIGRRPRALVPGREGQRPRDDVDVDAAVLVGDVAHSRIHAGDRVDAAATEQEVARAAADDRSWPAPPYIVRPKDGTWRRRGHRRTARWRR